MLAWLAMTALAAPGDSLTALAEREGWPAVAARVAAIVAETPKERKLRKRLDKAGISGLTMPTELFGAAALVYADPEPMAGCHWDHSVTCTIAAKATGDILPAEHRVRCRSKYGASIELPATATPDETGGVAWTVQEVEKCWDLGGVKVQIVPVGTDDLEGIGEGTELVPPERVELGWQEIEAIIRDRYDLFRYCFQRVQERRPGSEGTLVIKYAIAEDGSVSSAEVERSTLGDEELQECVRSRFMRLQFPKPRGGLTTGTYPFSFSP